MRRIPEPELMKDESQARAYAQADFSEPHDMFVRLWEEAFGGETGGRVIDLGCGPADVTVRFAKRFPGVTIDGVDGSEPMLVHARERLRREGLESRVQLVFGRLPGVGLSPGYDAVISNSLLHHLADPATLWDTVKVCARPGAPVLVMDLLRPTSEGEVHVIVQRRAAGAPEALRNDFFRSLLAAYRPEEVQAQLEEAGLDLDVRVVSDRHLIACGRR